MARRLIRSLPRPLALWAAVGIAACGEPALVGSFCREGARQCETDIASSAPARFPESGCVSVATTRQLVTRQEQSVERCELKTIVPTAPRAELYMRGWFVDPRIWRADSPDAGDIGNQLVVVRKSSTISGLEELPDGEVDCDEAMVRGEFAPLLVAQDSARSLEFGGAGLRVFPGDRLLIVQRYLNESRQDVEIGVELDLDCSATLPGAFLHPFEFVAGEPVQTLPQPGLTVDVSDTCVVPDRDIVLLRLAAEPVTVASQEVSLTTWVTFPQRPPALLPAGIAPLDLGSGLALQAGSAIDLRCQFQSGEVKVSVGSLAIPACHVAGLYQLPDGAADTATLSCR